MGYYQVHFGAVLTTMRHGPEYYYRKEFGDLLSARKFAAAKMREHGYSTGDVYDEGSGKWYLERIVEES